MQFVVVNEIWRRLEEGRHLFYFSCLTDRKGDKHQLRRHYLMKTSIKIYTTKTSSEWKCYTCWMSMCCVWWLEELRLFEFFRAWKYITLYKGNTNGTKASLHKLKFLLWLLIWKKLGKKYFVKYVTQSRWPQTFQRSKETRHSTLLDALTATKTPKNRTENYKSLLFPS